VYGYESGTLRCSRCPREFLTKDEAERHNKQTHLEEKTHAVE
jgi:uncharacterized C2H2 Zn-finger protein